METHICLKTWAPFLERWIEFHDHEGGVVVSCASEKKLTKLRSEEDMCKDSNK